jgi:hypothetical protein
VQTLNASDTWITIGRWTHALVVDETSATGGVTFMLDANEVVFARTARIIETNAVAVIR